MLLKLCAAARSAVCAGVVLSMLFAPAAQAASAAAGKRTVKSRQAPAKKTPPKKDPAPAVVSVSSAAPPQHAEPADAPPAPEEIAQEETPVVSQPESASQRSYLASNYKIQVGDVLEVIVQGSPEFTRDSEVNSDGTFDLPFMKRIPAVAKTPSQIESDLRERLRDYIRQPMVSIWIKKFRNVTILGQVRAPGQVAYVQGMHALDLLATAGGYTEGAVLSRAWVIRASGAERRVMRVDLGRALKQGDKTQDIEILPGDTMVIPQRTVGSWNWWVSNIFPTVTLIASVTGIILVMTRK